MDKGAGVLFVGVVEFVVCRRNALVFTVLDVASPSTAISVIFTMSRAAAERSA
jgi:hypothetical protein